jgi:hypothetical protein
MSTNIVTVVGNKEISQRLKGMLVDLRNTTATIIDAIKQIKIQARLEGFEDHETDLLIRSYLKGFLNKDQIKYVLHDKPRRAKQKSLTNKSGSSPPLQETITLPTEHKIMPQELAEPIQIQQEQEQQKPSEEFKLQEPDYAVEDLKIQLDNANGKITELTTLNKALEEKYRQLEARTRVSPSNQIPAVQGNILRTKVVVNQMFREIINLKGSKVIYANIVIDTTQNKYEKLEPI